MRRQRKSSGPAAKAKKSASVDQATAPPQRAKPPLVEQFHVAVDGQLKSGYGTYDAAEKAALAIKKSYPQLQVTVYDAKEQRHTAIERPKADADPREKSAHRARNTTLHAGALQEIAGDRH